jgi:hypothetical protein
MFSKRTSSLAGVSTRTLVGRCMPHPIYGCGRGPNPRDRNTEEQMTREELDRIYPLVACDLCFEETRDECDWCDGKGMVRVGSAREI